MKKSILAAAVLSMFAGVSQADSTIDLFQVAGSTETQSNILAGADVLADPTLATTQLNQAADAASISLIQGTVTDNVTIVTQAGAGIANVLANIDPTSISAGITDGVLSGTSDTAVDAGLTVERNIINVSQADASIANILVNGSDNYINTTQGAAGEIANISTDGTNNVIITSQLLTGPVSVVNHGVGAAIAITQ